MLLLEASEIFKSADILILFPYLHVENKKGFLYIIGYQVYLQAWQNFPPNR